jgi:hypothetical protein
MKRLDQGHLLSQTRDPQTKMSRQGIEHGPPRWEVEHSRKKNNLNSLLIAIQNISKYKCATTENARDITKLSSSHFQEYEN